MSDLEQQARDFWNTLPHCCGYPRCDGDLEGHAHSKECPAFEQPELLVPKIMALFAESHSRQLWLEAAEICEEFSGNSVARMLSERFRRKSLI